VRSLALLDSHGQVVSRGTETPIDLAPSTAAAMWERARKREEPPLALRFIERDGRIQVLTMTRVDARGPNPERFLLVSYDGDSVAHRILTRIFRSRPTLLPPGLAASRENVNLVSIRITLASGAVFFRTPHAFNARWRASVPFAQDSTVSVQVVLSPTIASEVLGASDPGVLLPWLAVIVVLVSVVIGVIAALAQRAASLAKVRGDFTAAVSHELRTPLTEIMLYAELIESRRGERTISAREAGRVILAEARRLYQLVENVLVIARTDRRMLRVRMATHDLRQTVAEAIRRFEPLAAKRSVHVRLISGVEVSGVFDPSAVAGVMLNLLENAARYGPRGQRVDVRVGRLDDATVYFEVDDAGPGIPIADRERVFGPYVRLPRDEYHSTSGSGLGLAVVKSLVEEMQGHVSLDESARGGVLARVCLKASRPHTVLAEVDQPTVESDVSSR
jgi:signal transduction histidine kinase